VLPSIGSTTAVMRRVIDSQTKKPKIGCQIGEKWIIQPSHNARRASVDVNYWKSFVRSGLTMPLRSKSSIMIFGNEPEAHALFADHMASEYSKRIEVDGYMFDQWDQKPGRPDNDMFDGLVGAAAAASMGGARAAMSPAIKGVSKVKTVSFAAMAAQKGR
jgi:hypothetical protein